MRVLLVCREDVAARYAPGLRQRGWHVEAANDVPMGLMVARQRPPDVAVVSSRLPGGGGALLITRLRGLLPTAMVPIVALTTEGEDPEPLLAAGATTSSGPDAHAEDVAAAVERAAGSDGEDRQVPTEAPRQLIADPARLAVLQETSLGSGGADPVMDHIAGLASELLPAPTGLVSLVAADGQHFVGRADRSGSVEAVRRTPLTHSFCQWAVSSGEPVVVEDSRRDQVLRHNAGVESLGVVGYAGFPIVVDGATLGTVCALDTAPRRWEDEDLSILRSLTEVASAELSARVLDRRAGGAEPRRAHASVARGLSALASLLRRVGPGGSPTTGRHVADLVDHFAGRLHAG